LALDRRGDAVGSAGSRFGVVKGRTKAGTTCRPNSPTNITMSKSVSPVGDPLLAAPREPEREETAYHEAGHAVVALKLGLSIRYVSIRPGEDFLGACELLPPERGLGPQPELTDDPASWLARGAWEEESERCEAEEAVFHESHIVSMLAGWAAEHRLARERRRDAVPWTDPRFALDRKQLAALALALYGSGDAASAQLEAKLGPARRLVKQQWPGIRRVAEALLERERLVEIEVRALMDTSTPGR
jgi:hypothetical protein